MSAAKLERRLLLKSLIGMMIAGTWIASIATSVNAIVPLHHNTHIPNFEECEKFTLTPDKYLERLHKVVVHGDLRDISFVEKTLQVKFDSPYTDDHVRDYFAGPKLSPYEVVLSVDRATPMKDRKKKASLWVGVPYFTNCEHLTRAKVEKHFSGRFSPVKVNTPDIHFERTIIRVNGKNIEFTYQYDDKNYASDMRFTQANFK